jgi:quinoprotein glucose dehydrogenase
MPLHKSLFILIVFLGACSKSPIPGDWPMYSADPSGSKYSALSQITRANVNNLEVAWTYRAGDMQKGKRTEMQCNPIIIKGSMYIITPGLKTVALDADTGIEIWKFDPNNGQPTSGTNRGLTYFDDNKNGRILYAVNSHIYCLDAISGDLIPTFGDEGKVLLNQGLGREADGLTVSATTPGTIYNGLYILGSRVGEGPSPAAPGTIRAFDAMTGKVKWSFHTIPHPGEEGYETWPEDAWKTVGGANSWGGITLDTKRGMVFCGTGSPSYDHWGGNRIGDNLFSNSILALDAATGKRKWHYQVVHHDVWDYDIPCAPNLVQVKKDGNLIDAIAQPTKMGHLFVLNRDTGEPIFPITEESVPQSDIPGEKTSPTQPFPPVALRYGQQRLTPEEATNISDSANLYVKERLSEMVTGNIYIPPGIKPSVTLPQFNGGSEWGGASYDPENRMLYVSCSNEAEWISMVLADGEQEMTQFDFGKKIFQSTCVSCHGEQNVTQLGSPSLSSLRKMGRDTAELVIKRTLTNGKGQMPVFSSLTKDETDAIVAFILQEGQAKILTKDQLKSSISQEIPWVATGHNEIKTPDGYPVNKRPWGTISAINMDEGKIKWQVPLGTYPGLEAQGFPPTGTFNIGGSLVTAGGLVFVAASMDERMHAYDKNTGELLWEYQLDAGGYATPSCFQVNGKQYIVIAAGGGGKPGTKSGDAYYCFKLRD